ncbi:fimbrial isopeptide formation D2 family protein [Aequitasia blattaphilus]|uniref:Isopeptide-forming domain-containing fimbrial protein n=1 Tax=Aequitasia blattaphilus TaxID=2949332 RepID=A0ABT1E817_9FIRM|nr:isopeptide-forming domain-containing fimbrial protein [Aequitasia blattaphilus]MCP1101974.1 isopeptide-forming domain-containing fimbrial protein [Aequitasia blattaphilus]MCR8614614.1 isopeptide-forming domain-containing fimbrial protein [Aequitasia blattaphilus]
MKKSKQKQKSIFVRITSMFLLLVMMLSLVSPGLREVEAADQLYPPGRFERWKDLVMPGNNTGMSSSSSGIEQITVTQSDRSQFLSDPRHYHGFAAGRAENFFPTNNTGSIEVNYEGVLEMPDGRPVGLRLTVSNFSLTGPSIGGVAEPIPFISFSEDIKEGHNSNGISSFDIHAEFYYGDTGEKYLGSGMYFYYGSLNLGEGVIFKSGNVVDTIRLTDTNVQTLDLGWEGLSDNFVDVMTDPTFNRNTIVAKTNSAELFYTVYTRSLKYTQGRGLLDPSFELPDSNLVKEWSGYNSDLWCAISFSPMAATAPMPEKDMKVAGSDWIREYDGVKLGEEITYQVKQRVETLGYNGAYKYDSFSFSDKLPAEVDYSSATICKNGTDIGSGNYTINYEPNSHTVTGTINANYLANGVDYKGETYQFVIKTKVNKKAFDTGAAFTNKGTTTINGDKAETNVTTVKPVMPKLSIEKTINGKKYEEYKVGEKIPYKLVIKNTTAGSVAKGVVIKDHSLPTDLEIDVSSVKVSGIQGATASVTNNKLTVNIAELTTETVTVTFTGVANKTLNGKETINTASVSAKNVPDEPKDTSKVYVNSPEITLSKEVEKYEYQVGDDIKYTLKGKQTISGATAKNVVIKDESLPADMSIDPKSVKVTGQANVVLNGKTLENKPTVNVDGSKISVSWPYLQNEEVAVSFTVKAPADKNGMEIINTAIMSASNVEKNNIEAKAKVWINTPKLVLDKRADRESKEYKVSDLVTYTIDLTNKQVGTIARNIIIKDEIKTEGVKLQKGSIVFTDSKGKVIKPISIEIVGNTFTAVLEKDSVNPDNYSIYENGKVTEQKKQNPEELKTETLITCEYQVAIVSESLAGKSVENVATASSDNTPDEKDDEVVIVPKDEKFPGLSIVKTADKAEYNIGDTFHYQLDISNKVPGTNAKEVVIEDAFQVDGAVIDQESIKVTFNGKEFEPKEVTFSDDGKSFKIVTGKNLTQDDRLKVRYKGTFEEAALVQDDGIINIATASATEVPPVSDDNIVYIKQKNGLLNIEKSSDKETYCVGETGKYKITVMNKVPDSKVLDVTIEDAFQTKGVKAISSSLKLYFNDEEIKLTEKMLKVKDGVFSIVTGKNLTDQDKITVTYDVLFDTAVTDNTVVNKAVAEGKEVPKVDTDNKVTLLEPSLNLIKTVDKEVYQVGETGKYTLEITNLVADTVAKKIIVTDENLTKGSELKADTIKVFFNGEALKLSEEQVKVKGNKFTIETRKDLSDKDKIVVTYDVVFTDEIEADTIVNKASVKSENTPPAEAEHMTKVLRPLLQIQKAADKESYVRGETANYRLTVVNTVEGSVVKNVIITDENVTKGSELKADTIKLFFNGEALELKKEQIIVEGNKFTIETGKDLTVKDKLEVTYSTLLKEEIEEDVVTNKATAKGDNVPPSETELKVKLPKPGAPETVNGEAPATGLRNNKNLYLGIAVGFLIIAFISYLIYRKQGKKSYNKKI